MRTLLLTAALCLACGPAALTTSGDEAPHQRGEPPVAASGEPRPQPHKAPQPRVTPLPGLLTPVELENGLPYDGCTWVVTAGADLYAPDAASEAAIVTFTQSAIGKTKALADFTLTGNTRKVPCGWAESAALPEISIRSLSH